MPTIKQWNQILNTVKLNDSNDDILEQIKVKLQDQFEVVYEEWEQKSFDINHLFNISGKEFTLLHIAAENGNKDVVITLLEKGANVNAADQDGWTPLHLAARYDHLEIVKHLIEKGADSSLKNKNGKTPVGLTTDKNIIQLLTNGTKKTGNDIKPSSSGKNNITLQNAQKNKRLTVVAPTMLAIAGVTAGIAIAVYLEMLAVGIVVGACCLIAAAIIYYCSGPSGSLEKSSAEAVKSAEEVVNPICSS